MKEITLPRFQPALLEDKKPVALAESASELVCLCYDFKEKCLAELHMPNKEELGIVNWDPLRKILPELQKLSNNPSFARLYGHGDVNDWPYYITEVVDGEHWAEFSKRMSGLPEANALHLTLEMAHAVRDAVQFRKLASGISLNSPRIILRDGGYLGVKIMDYGLFKGNDELRLPTVPEQVQFIGKFLQQLLTDPKRVRGEKISANSRELTKMLRAVKSRSEMDLDRMVAEIRDCMKASAAPGLSLTSVPVTPDSFRPQNKLFDALIDRKEELPQLLPEGKLVPGETTSNSAYSFPTFATDHNEQVHLLPSRSLFKGRKTELDDLRPDSDAPSDQLVNPIGYTEKGNVGVLAEETINGFTLEELLRHQHHLSAEDAFPLLKALNECLNEAHENGAEISELAPDHVWIAFSNDTHTKDAGLVEKHVLDWPSFEVRIRNLPSMRSLSRPFGDGSDISTRARPYAAITFMHIVRVTLRGLPGSIPPDLQLDYWAPMKPGSIPELEGTELDAYLQEHAKKDRKRKTSFADMASSTENSAPSPLPSFHKFKELAIKFGTIGALGIAASAMGWFMLKTTKKTPVKSPVVSLEKELFDEIANNLELQKSSTPPAPIHTSALLELDHSGISELDFGLAGARRHLEADEVPEAIDTYLQIARSYPDSQVVKSAINSVLNSVAAEPDHLSDQKLQVSLQSAFRMGFPSATKALANYWENKDRETFLTILKTASERKETNAMMRLGEHYRNSGQMKEAYHWFALAAEDKNHQATFEMARGLINGDGIHADPAKGIDLLRSAANSGNIDATAMLAEQYLEGIHLEANPDKAIQLIQAAVSKGNIRAHILYGKLLLDGIHCPPDAEKATQMFRYASLAGSTEGMRLLGTCYEDGKGVKQSDAMASLWYEEAANSGNALAKVLFAKYLIIGKGVARDPNQALQILQEAATQTKDVSVRGEAFFRLGKGFQEADFGFTDIPKAMNYYAEASHSGNTNAMIHLAHLHLTAKSSSLDPQKGIELFRKAADLRDSRAMFFLANCFENGDGTQVDSSKAKIWYAKAASLGHPEARSWCDRMAIPY